MTMEREPPSMWNLYDQCELFLFIHKAGSDSAGGLEHFPCPSVGRDLSSFI